jgi:hypothetical protein
LKQPVPTDTWVVVEPGSDPNAVAAQQLRKSRPGRLAGYLFIPYPCHRVIFAGRAGPRALFGRRGLGISFQQFAQQQFSQVDDEPLYADLGVNEQWHLRNTFNSVNLNLPLVNWVNGTSTEPEYGVRLWMMACSIPIPISHLSTMLIVGISDNDTDPAPRAPLTDVYVGTNDCHGTATGRCGGG